VVTALIVWITEYYTGTGFRPVKSHRQASSPGHGTNIIQGLGRVAANPPPAGAWSSASASCASYGSGRPVRHRHRRHGHAVAWPAWWSRWTPLARSPTTPAASPKWPACRRRARVTDALDAVGNTTKAVTKGYAIGSAGLGALVLFAAYTGPEILHRAGYARRGYFDGGRSLRPLAIRTSSWAC
jgi:K(+)-stimulated pyrophosphate-energized sodium pump